MTGPVLLITYTRLDITELEAEEIIGDGYRAVDAVAALAGGKEMEEGIIYHFNGMGSSAMISPPEKTEDLTRSFGTLKLRVINGAAVFTSSLKERVSAHPDVTSVCECHDGAYPTMWQTDSDGAGIPNPPPSGKEWNLESIHANGVVASYFTGKGIKIAIIDTGIADHKDLNMKGGVSFCEGKADFRNDDFGHGTHCAGIAAGRLGGIATEAELFSIKVAHREPATPQAILAGLSWALRNRMNVVSISLSGPAVLAYIPACANAVQALMAINCVVVASTGDISDNVGFPANTPGIIAVGGCDSQLDLLDSTCIGGNGNHLTIAAPGQGIKTTFHANDGYIESFSGSSAATPHVAGLVALIQQKFKGITPLQVIGRILASAQPMNIRSDQRDVLGDVTLIDCEKALALL